MKERPILFNGPMVRAILEGHKTQTRRVLKVQPDMSVLKPEYQDPSLWEFRKRFMMYADDWSGYEHAMYRKTESGADLPVYQHRSPFGEPGDRLWVREAWRSTSDLDAHSGARMAELCLDAGYRSPWAPIQFEADTTRRNWEHTTTPPHDREPAAGRYRHARFMPRWASRITLEVTGVRVERLQDISEQDAIAEGIGKTAAGFWSTYGRSGVDGTYSPRSSFHCLWDSVNGAESWDANPWVWVVEFKRVSEAA